MDNITSTIDQKIPHLVSLAHALEKNDLESFMRMAADNPSPSEKNEIPAMIKSDLKKTLH